MYAAWIIELLYFSSEDNYYISKNRIFRDKISDVLIYC